MEPGTPAANGANALLSCYMFRMTQLLEMAVEAARHLSPEEQDELARTILEIVHGTSEEIYVLSEEENAAIDEGLAHADQGEFASDEEVRAIFAKYAK